ncbi:hypothetical protein H0H93_011176, partial [Arthromyces matolae]
MDDNLDQLRNHSQTRSEKDEEDEAVVDVINPADNRFDEADQPIQSSLCVKNVVDRRPLRSSPLARPALTDSSAGPPELDLADTPVPSPPSPSPTTSSSRKSSPSKNLVRFAESLLNQPQNKRPSSKTPCSIPSPPRSCFRQSYSGYPSLPPQTEEQAFPALPSDPFRADVETPLPRARVRTLSQPSAFTPHRMSLSGFSRNSPSTSKTAPSTSAHNGRRASLPAKKYESGFDNWMAANTYASTPRFTRLGLHSPNIVLPISAREYRRQAANKAKLNTVREWPLEGTKSTDSFTTSDTASTLSLGTPPSSWSRPGSCREEASVAVVDEDRTIEAKDLDLGHSGRSVLPCKSPTLITSRPCTKSQGITGPCQGTNGGRGLKNAVMNLPQQSCEKRHVWHEHLRGRICRFWKSVLLGTQVEHKLKKSHKQHNRTSDTKQPSDHISGRLISYLPQQFGRDVPSKARDKGFVQQHKWEIVFSRPESHGQGMTSPRRLSVGNLQLEDDLWSEHPPDRPSQERSRLPIPKSYTSLNASGTHSNLFAPRTPHSRDSIRERTMALSNVSVSSTPSADMAT